MFSEYRAITQAIERIPSKLGNRHNELSTYFSREYPEGVYLKEKMKLFFEAITRLHNRKIEVLEAEGAEGRREAVEMMEALLR